ncbi:MAG: YaiO family outer membrane beta-barrel protein, partial [Acidiferrobacterales bacterium]
PYRAGLILARAYVANHQEQRAAQIYSQLARRYPRDPDLARQAVLASVHARNFHDAGAIYAGLPKTQQQSILTDLGDNYDLIYPNSIAVEAGWAHASGITPSEDYYEGVRAKFALASGTLVGDLVHAHRFGENADSYGASYYFSMGHGYSGEGAVSYSPSDTFLARESAAFVLTKDFRSYALYGGVRHLVFSGLSANVFLGGIALDINRNLTIRTGLYYVPQTSAYSYLFAPQWTRNGNKTFLYLAAGMAGEQLNVRSAILRTPSDSIKLGRIQQIAPTVSLEGDVFYEHRSGLYDRSGVDVSLIKRW